jgi:peptidoglycan pentaglycine glycine transferase (the first glycine)
MTRSHGRGEGGAPVVTRLLPVDERERWDAFVSSWSHFGLLQGSGWGDFKGRSGWKVFRIAVEVAGELVAGAQMLVRPLPLGVASLAYIPRGPLVDWGEPEVVEALLRGLHRVARQRRAIALKIEPPLPQTPAAIARLTSHGFRRSRFDNQPQATLINDLTPDLDSILADMSSTTRYNLRYSERKGVTVREGSRDDLPIAYELLRSTAGRGEFPVRPLDYYATQWEVFAPAGRLKLFLAMYEGQAIAMSVPAAFGDRAASLHSGSSDTYRKLKPNDLLAWSCLRWAKEQGCRTYDFWGIPDEAGEMLLRGETVPEGRRGGLWGVYYFKRGFGGSPCLYVGAYDFVYSRAAYGLMDAVVSRTGSTDEFARLGDLLRRAGPRRTTRT